MKIKKKYLITGIVIICILIVLGLFFIAYRSNYDSYPKIAQNVADATIIVKAIDGNKNEIPVGTGFIVDKRGYIITAKHNFEKISNQNNIKIKDFVTNFGYVEIKNKYGERINYKVLIVENQDLERKDVLLLKLKDTPKMDLNTVKIANKNEVKSIGLEIGFVGYAHEQRSNNSFDMFFSKGILSNKKLDVKDQTEPFYTVNAFATFGYSGSPVFLTKNGKVIGIIEQGSSDETGKTGIVIVPPIHEVPDIINRMEKN